jgi:hypothetical protein
MTNKTITIIKNGMKVEVSFEGGNRDFHTTIDINEEYNSYVWPNWASLSAELDIRLGDVDLDAEYELLTETEEVKKAGTSISDYMRAKKEMENNFRSKKEF